MLAARYYSGVERCADAPAPTGPTTNRRTFALLPLIRDPMQPLLLTHCTLTTSLGQGVAEHLSALAENRSGLAPCSFETARLDTWTGQVPDTALPALEQRLARFDCRNNRLAVHASR